ncbi:hypothetical protein NK638_00465 [Psychrobacter sp. A3]|uniref:hypothetical protein n=1 Tax=Psychrobacter sp. A3 TaxID=2992754 RepID=UPI00237A58E0|nr:hypothetical protein [Psychrobacter sp. A3]MDE0490031.1 hypothetical protein [Psychrobacter sp. A3]
MNEIFASIITSLVTSGISIAVVVLGLSSWLGGVWSKRIDRLENAEIELKKLEKKSTIDSEARKENAEMQKQLDELKHQHQKLLNKDHVNHSIAQDTYAKFFSSKMDAHIKLANLKRNYLLSIKEFVHDPENGPPLNHASTSIMISIRNTINENYIYLSNSLLEVFEIWNEEFIKIDKINTIDIMERWSEFSSIESKYGASASDLANEETQLTYQKFMEDYPELWDSILNVIDSDIKDLRRRYDL